jgi:hypothetical protein
LLIVWWHARTYSLNMTISDISLKSSNMGHILCMSHIGFVMLPSAKTRQMKNRWSWSWNFFPSTYLCVRKWFHGWNSEKKSVYAPHNLCKDKTFSNLLHANKISNHLPNIKLLINTLLSIEYIFIAIENISISGKVRIKMQFFWEGGGGGGRGFNCQN